MIKQIIFIGGTSYSGSTMFDMILANDLKGYSLGEIYALFRPYRKHHFEEIRKVKMDEMWRRILDDGESNLYKNLFEYFTEIDFFVDSSKNPLWIKNHIKILEKQNIEFKNILIYKNPIESAYSFNKRGMFSQWEKSWVNYHRLYFSLINNFRTVSYKDLVKNPDTLKKICDYLEIPYFKNKQEFWEKEQTTFFGNNRARIHTKNLSSEGDEKLDLSKNKNEYRKIYYEEVKDKSIIRKVNNSLEKNKFIIDILNELENNNIMNEKYRSYSTRQALCFSSFNINLRRMKESLLILKAQILHK